MSHNHHHPRTAPPGPPEGTSRRELLARGVIGGIGMSGLAALAGGDAVLAQEPGGAPRAFAPLPPAAAGPTIPASGIYVEQLGRDLYYATEGFYQAMFLVHDRGVVLVDAPPTMGNNLTKAFRQVTQKPLTHLVYSHSHGDHIGGAAQAVTTAREQHPDQKVQIIGHRRTAALLAEKWPSVTELGGPRPMPTVTFAKGKTLRVGRHTLRLEHRGANHSPDNLFIWAPQQKVLMLVDVLFPGWTPFKDLAFSEDIPGWFRAHDQALGYRFQKVVAGHVARVGTRADAIVQREYIHDLRDATAAAVGKVDFRDIASALDTNNAWAIFDAYYAEVARVAAAAVTPKWIDRLGAVDVFTDDHALTLTAAVRLD